MAAKGFSKSKYDKKAMIPKLISLFKANKGREDFCKHFKISETTFTVWTNDHPEFMEAYGEAKANGKVEMIKLGMDNMLEYKDRAKLNTVIWTKIFNNRFERAETKQLKMLRIKEAKTIEGKLEALIESMADGDVSPSEAVQISRILEVALKIKEHGELEERISQIEQANKIGLSDGEFKEVKDDT